MFHNNPIDVVKRQKVRYLGAFSSFDYNLIVCIENYDDERFWAFIFSKIERLKPKFIDLDGKKNILKFENYFDKEFISCVDSDYDYILKKPYLDNNYIFHTYVYAVENYCVYPSTLNALKSTCNIDNALDFEDLFTQITPIIKNALFYDIYLKENHQDCVRNVFKFNNISIEDLELNTIIESIKKNVFDTLGVINEDLLVSYDNTILEDIYINEAQLHLYVEGHIIFDSILDVLTKLQNKNSNHRREKIKESYNGKQRGDKLNELKNKEFDIETLLRTNYKEAYHIKSSSMHQIILDIKNQSFGAV
jgi:hypothetical protein